MKGDFYGSSFSPKAKRMSSVSSIAAFVGVGSVDNLDQGSEDSEGDQIWLNVNEECLIPSRTAKTWSRVIRFYY